MDVFLVKLFLIIGHIATAMLLLIMNNLPQKYIHSGLTFVIKHPLIRGWFCLVNRLCEKLWCIVRVLPDMSRVQKDKKS